MRQWIEQHQVLAVAIGVCIALILWYLRFVWAVALLALIVASSLVPVIDWLQSHRIPRALAIVVTYLALIAIVAGVLVPGILSFIGQSAGLVDQLTAVLQQIDSPHSFLSQFGLSTDNIISAIESTIVPFTSSAVAAAAGILSMIVISIYLLYDWHGRPKLARGTEQVVDQMQHELGAWARGQIVLCVTIGVLTFIALEIIGLPYAAQLAALAGIFELIPYAGPIASAIPSIVLGLDVSLSQGIAVLIAYTVIQQLESHLLVPIVMKNAIRLHPVAVILAILIGFELMGIVGAIIAVPLASICRIAIEHVMRE